MYECYINILVILNSINKYPGINSPFFFLCLKKQTKKHQGAARHYPTKRAGGEEEEGHTEQTRTLPASREFNFYTSTFLVFRS